MNGSIAIDFFPFVEAPEQTYLWDENARVIAMRPPKYDPSAKVTMVVWQDFTDIKIDMTQEEFITMVRALNNEKNKLLKWRRMYDAEHGERAQAN